MKTDQQFFEGWRRRQGDFRRLGAILILILGVVVAIWFVRWVSQSVGLGRIGAFYEQAEEIGTP